MDLRLFTSCDESCCAHSALSGNRGLRNTQFLRFCKAPEPVFRHNAPEFKKCISNATFAQQACLRNHDFLLLSSSVESAALFNHDYANTLGRWQKLKKTLYA